jgi:hypothetical protein
MKPTLVLFILLSFEITHAQSGEEQRVSNVVHELYRFLTFSDTSQIKHDSIETVFTSDGKLLAAFGEKPMVWTVREFITNSKKGIQSFETIGASETELASRIDIFGNIAHVLSTYELKIVKKGSEIVRRGLNSIQLIRMNNKWLIYSLIWDRENATLKLPEKYLSSPSSTKTLKQ